MEKKDFVKNLTYLQSATSLTGKKYRLDKIFDGKIYFTRENKSQSETIYISELFELFTKERVLNTTVAKSYISGRVQSPAVAILNELKLKQNNYLTTVSALADEKEKIFKNETAKKSANNLKDETRFL
ncbi:hypothetical protein [Kaistella antarctica]|uniref:Uncharacterized protein n=1 Tax=Kaistella antarctica TaxID=266748 RepID=A0A3S4YSR3_9FLAO|nr:hypothetical protein [Kaistella antarctica]KEY19063.1 hypothetical protein HY04_11540 [Kaistella antarctica]SEW12050.1 hypothetical protein SAMN05421765_2429 [Kaistella antarctica]VEH98959.1 Uncharacterised protein [Kaistella antarctica]